MMKYSYPTWTLLTGTAIVILGLDISTAYAQLDSVTVTARKREETAKDVPAAVTAVGSKTLEQYSLTTLQDVAAFNPQLSIVQGGSGSGASISIRGGGSSFLSIGVEQSVAVVFDGVYFGQGRVVNEGLFDTSQVEILSGPQLLFFGKNATSGVVAIKTRDPGDTFEVIGRVGFEAETKQVSTEAVISGPINDKVGIRLAARWSKMYGGHIENEATTGALNTFDVATGAVGALNVPAPSDRKWPGEDDLLGRLTVKLTPSDDFTFTLKGSANSHQTLGNSRYEMAFCPFGGVSQVSGEPCDRNWKVRNDWMPDEIAASDPLLGRHGGVPFANYLSYYVTGTAEYQTDKFQITSVFNYQYVRNRWGHESDLTNVPNLYAGENSVYKAYSNETRVLSTFDGPVNFMLGVYYQKTKLSFMQDVDLLGLENSAAVDPTTRYVAYRKESATDGETLSAFGQATWNIVPELELAAGGRYIHETKDSRFVQSYVNPAFIGVFQLNKPIVGDQTFNDFAPEVTLTWKASPNLTVYGAYKQGIKSGGFSNSATASAATLPSDLIFGPEKAAGFEAGIKSTWLDDTLRLNLTAYNYKFKDLQIDYFNAPTFATITFNAGRARTDGVEFSGQWAPAEIHGLVLNSALNYNNGRYKENIAPCYAGQSIAQGCTLSSGPPSFTTLQDLSGVPTAISPKWVATLGLDYDFQVADGLVAGISVSGRYSSSLYASAFGDPVPIQGAYATLDAVLRLGHDDDRWQIALIGKNLTNTYAFFYAADVPNTGAGTGTANATPADRFVVSNMPRTIEIQFTYRY